MERENLVYEMEGKSKGGLRIYLLPKNKRPNGVDGIKIEWANTNESINGERYSVCVKDWEALCLIEGLTRALVEKKLKTKPTKERKR